MIERGVKEIGVVWNHGLHPNLMEFNQGKSKVWYFFKKIEEINAQVRNPAFLVGRKS